MKIPSSIIQKIEKRKSDSLFRELKTYSEGIDFFSNDYLGFSRKNFNINSPQSENHIAINGSTGSRLISGNSEWHIQLEKFIADFFKAESALLFNSGYDANIGLLSAIGGRNDVFLIDELCHASIHDGCRLSFAKTFKFRHNDISSLKNLIEKNSIAENIFVVVESIYSMDGDFAPLNDILNQFEKDKVFLIVDEAHATGVIGKQGKGLVNELKLNDAIFARIHTFGKAVGCHGACVLGSEMLINFLVNFARSFIYTTALPASAIHSIKASLEEVTKEVEIHKLKNNIEIFRQSIQSKKNWIPSSSAIQSILVNGNKAADDLADFLLENNFLVKAIKSPTVPKGQERVRICLHSFNTEKEIQELLNCIMKAT